MSEQKDEVVSRLSVMSYTELRKMAKDTGIKANQKSHCLVKALADYVINTPHASRELMMFDGGENSRAKTPKKSTDDDDEQTPSKESFRFSQYFNDETAVAEDSNKRKSRRSIRRSELNSEDKPNQDDNSEVNANQDNLDSTYEIIEDEVEQNEKHNTDTEEIRRNKIRMEVEELVTEMSAKKSKANKNVAAAIRKSQVTTQTASDSVKKRGMSSSTRKGKTPVVNNVTPVSEKKVEKPNSRKRKSPFTDSKASTPLNERDSEEGKSSKRTRSNSKVTQNSTPASQSSSRKMKTPRERLLTYSVDEEKSKSDRKVEVVSEILTPATKSAKKLKTPGAIGDRFKAAHEREFSKMADIDEHLDKHAKRHEKLTAGQSERLKKLATPAKKTNDVEPNRKEMLRRTPGAKICKPVTKPAQPAANEVFSVVNKPATPGRLAFKFGTDSPTNFKFGSTKKTPKSGKKLVDSTKGDKKRRLSLKVKKMKAQPAKGPVRVLRDRPLPKDDSIKPEKPIKHKTPKPKGNKFESSSTGKRQQYDPKVAERATGSYRKHKGTLPTFVDTRNMTNDHFEAVKAAMKMGVNMKNALHTNRRQASNEKNRVDNRTEATARRGNVRTKLLMEKRGLK